MSDERARLFVALELPEPVRASLVDWRTRSLADVAGLRLVREEALHVTLCFLGWRAAVEIDAIAAACETVSGAAAGRLSVGESVWLPKRRPRVLAVRIEDSGDALTQLEASLSDVLQAGGWYEPEARPFLAHVTVARVPARGW